MSWQLWVVIGVAAVGLMLLAAARMRRARKIFDDITEPERPEVDRLDDAEPDADELARARARHIPHDPGHRRHG
ncbi:threonine dehydrogenase-like Zn-dependent dehydrogenase [Kribbella aluminosa]|uniref:Threonine dehydrogenase-like Zn-dependent dehydrogenase n=1 Tax=Kribbella aluminosa TaxID=416017 RepID=A0ABS4UCY9_9ACTN|nr:hypothetical protein [Kribbella aluminosa]MBP2349513.1 threonine dehydrogenase-like Zn-dependent dehydrogenase [Kribbella aluminosa]